MIQSVEDLEGYLGRLERPFERVGDGTYVLFFGPRRALVALRIEPPVLLIRAEIGQVPQAVEPSRALYKKLLELNATELFHVAYGLDGDRVVLSGALALESVDLNEIEATLSDIDLALSEHVIALQGIVKS